MPACTPTRISSNSPIETAAAPPSRMRQWREFHSLSLEEMSERLKRLGIKGNCSAGCLDRMERGDRTLDPLVVDGYAMVFGCFDREITDLPPVGSFVSAWFEALTPQQRRTVRAMLHGIESRTKESRAKEQTGELERMIDSRDRRRLTLGVPP